MLLVKQNDAWSSGSKIILHFPLCTEDIIIIIKANRDSRSLPTVWQYWNVKALIRSITPLAKSPPS